jgi:1-aminocyclopropane-1-carboxylate deaminase/D-cysteine desulfhydrase-like pyridoxal-dependent ACC family enzyme
MQQDSTELTVPDQFSKQIKKPFIQSILLAGCERPIDVLRLDEIHPVVSGNKWYKLKYYLAEALASKTSEVCTFGGPWSNHIVATAFVAKQLGLLSFGIIRGERPPILSAALEDAENYGMKLTFLARKEYDTNRYRNVPTASYMIPEGGYGHKGMMGMSTVVSDIAHFEKYDLIVCASGYGTMAAGLIRVLLPHQTLIAVPVVKDTNSVEQAIKHLAVGSENNRWIVWHEAHQGGYARYSKKLVDYIAKMRNTYNLPLDIVYTAKAFSALENALKSGAIDSYKNILFIHSGGLQGNRSIIT